MPQGVVFQLTSICGSQLLTGGRFYGSKIPVRSPVRLTDERVAEGEGGVINFSSAEHLTAAFKTA